MSGDRFDRITLLDWGRSACLCDVGAPGQSVAVAVTADGRDVFWLLDETEPHADYPRYGDARQPHEQHGPLPDALRERIWPTPRRGRPTKGTGRPCRIAVSAPAEACRLHSERQAAP
ncbi:hypothetical protein MTIM_40080 [Mycobacterium timonense]|uniref:Uncharacterized protein n=1 Tax=Mycobacterium timonense TaxID=701043 RepID=A0A7I9ZAZ3_9MYCO|nr:hypothetical protein MTIM_40080 [Mycobacterium timonense]